MIRAVAIGISCLVLASCGQDYGKSLKSGEAVAFENRHEVGRQALSPDQLQSLSQWFGEHRSGWHGLITPASSEPGELQLRFNDTDGKSTVVNVIAQADGHRYLRVTTSDTWAYVSRGGLFKSWAAARPISADELDDLQALLHRKH